MKKIILTINIVILSLIIVSSSYPINAESIIPEEIRIGLKQYYENIDEIHLNNDTLVMGYIIKDKWQQEYEFKSSNGFTFIPTSSNYLITDQSYNSYGEADSQVNILREQGYNANVGTAAKGIWKVYVGYANSYEASNILKELNGFNNLSFHTAEDNGLRTMMISSSGYPLIMENTYQHPQFMTKDLTYGAPVLDLGIRKYRGRMEIGRYKESGITAVNVVELDYYLYGVLPSEMIPSWPIEALKAQAVAARNYAVYYSEVVNKYSSEPYDLCDTVNSQVYKGYDVENDNTNKAVNETSYKLIYFGDKIIPSYFFSTSGGHTENSENVWSGTVPYLKGVPDLYEIQPEKQPWLTELTSSDIKEKLAKYDINIGEVVDVIPLNYTDAKRVTELKIIGTTGEHSIKKETIRTWLGLKSRKFTLVKENDIPRQQYTVESAFNKYTISINDVYVMDATNNVKQFTPNEQFIVLSNYNIDNIPVLDGKKDTYIFVGEGWGHGVGMSQSGAKGMALHGFTFDQILEYYYTGTEVR